MTSQRRVAVTGLGPVTPIGVGTADFWSGLLEQRCGLRRTQAFDPSRFASQLCGEIDGLKVANSVPKSYRKASKIMARDIELAVTAAYQAVTDAGLKTKCLLERGDVEGEPSVDSSRFGVNIGAGLICADLSELAEALHASAQNGEFSFAHWGSEGMTNLTPLWLLKFLPNMLACHVTIVHDARGPSNTITCSEASSHLAIGEAYRTIVRGAADVCICGGAESKVNPMALLRQELGQRLSQHNDDPATACRPFAADREGTVVSEGAGLVVLEELEHAQARGARIYAELIGFGAAHDAYQATVPSVPHPEGRGTALAVRKALRDADLDAAAIDLVGTFACGLRAHDAAEVRGLRSVFGPRLAELPLLNFKAGLGNNGAGTSALDFIGTVLALHYGTLPAAPNSATVDPELAPLNVISRGPVDAAVEHACSTAYALSGGQNAALVIKRYRA